MKNLIVKQLENYEITEVYNNHMVNDFPKQELKPLNSMLVLQEKGQYEGLGIYEEDILCAYGMFLIEKNRNVILMDYFAVCNDKRQMGYGSSALKAIGAFYHTYNGILLECESIFAAASFEEGINRNKRMDFYKKNGCIPTTAKSHVYGVDFSLYYLPLMKTSIDVKCELEHLYRMMLGEEKYHKHVRIWERNQFLDKLYGWNFNSLNLKPRNALCDVLQLEHPVPRIISLIGAGGKTSTMYQLADELVERGKRVVITTTTHIKKPMKANVMLCEDWNEICDKKWEESLVIIGKPVEHSGIDKLCAPSGIMQIGEHVDFILIESDGAKGMPLKVPATHEPVIHPDSQMVIACVGLSALEKPFKEVCFRFDSHGSWVRKNETELVNEEDITIMLMDLRGSRKGVDAAKMVEYRVVLNQADTQEKIKMAETIIRRLPPLFRYGSAVTSYDIRE